MTSKVIQIVSQKSVSLLNFVSLLKVLQFLNIFCQFQDYPKKGVLFRDITTLIKNEKAFTETINQIIERSKIIIWNGPMGVFEMSNFENGTKKIGESICRSTKNGAFSLIGGGDSIASIKKFNS